jgi:hypothetical protein
MPRVCPQCGSERIYRSHRRGVVERLLALCGLKSRRCHECNVRFVSIGKSALLRNDMEAALRRVGIVFLTAIAILVIVSLVLWFSRKEANPSSAAWLRHPSYWFEGCR